MKKDFKEEIPVMEPINETPVEEKVEPVVPEIIKGVVTGCVRLNIRKNPYEKADIIGRLDKGESVVILSSRNPADKFYKIETEDGIIGFCMKQYIDLK